MNEIHIPDAEELENADEQVFLQLVEQYRIKASDTYAEKEYLLERDGIGFSPRGNVCALTAEKKAGKSWFAMAMSAAYLNGKYLGMQARIPEGYTPHVLYFDTEQDQGDGQRIQRRVHQACGWSFDLDNEQFKIFHLRELNPAERREVVNKAIRLLPCDLVIVDGIRDLISDFNDLEESAAVIQEHMTLSSERNCCIWDVLHVNPNSEKMRGHLGTELGNKVADILYMTKNRDRNNEDNTTYKMEETDARSHKDIHSITFRIDDEVSYGAPVLLSVSEEEEIDQQRADELRTVISRYLNEGKSMSRTRLKELMKKGEQMGSSKAWKQIGEAITLGVLEEIVGGNVRLVTKEQNNEEQSEMPF